MGDQSYSIYESIGDEQHNKQDNMTALIASNPPNDEMPSNVPCPVSSPPRRKSSLDLLKKAAASGSTRIRSISNTSIRSFFANDPTAHQGVNADGNSNNIPGEIAIDASDSTALAEPTTLPSTGTGPAPTKRRGRRRSSSINSSKTRDSFEIMVSQNGGCDDVRRGSLYRPRSDTLEELATIRTSALDTDGRNALAADDADDSDEAHIHRLVACLNMTGPDSQEDVALAESSSNVRPLPAKGILRTTSQPNLDEPGFDSCATNPNSSKRSRFLRRRSTSNIISSSKRCEAVMSS